MTLADIFDHNCNLDDFSDTRPSLTLTVAGVSIKCLIDTGASCSIIRKDIFEEICNNSYRPMIVGKSKPLRSVYGNLLKTNGIIRMKFDEFQHPITLIVSEEIAYKCIIGSDILNECDILGSRKTLIYRNKEFMLGEVKIKGVESLSLSDRNTEYKEINVVLEKFSDIFCEKGETNGRCEIAPMRILTSGVPFKRNAYKIPLLKQEVVKEHIDNMLRENVIRKSNSPYASPVLLVPKSDGTTRFCVDYRELNKQTIKDSYPLPNMKDIFNRLGGSKIFSTLDLKAGYHQIPLVESSKEKTAFITHYGLYEFNRIPFGLTNAPAVFQRTMDYILHELIGHCVYVYIDDIIVYSKNPKDHAKHLSRVFELTQEAGLKYKPSKCNFGKERVELLGFIVCKEGVKANPDKVKPILELRSPNSVKEIRSFLGMTGFYRDTIPNYAEIAMPLVELTKKNRKFSWGNKQEQAFQHLKIELQSNNVMQSPDINKPYILYTDACDYSIGGILTQVNDAGVEKIIQYVSKALGSTQLRWPVIEKEAFALIYCLRKLTTYLYGARFIVYTDHKPIISLFIREMNNTKIQRWAIELEEFDCEIRYKKGSENIRADFLSRIRHPDITEAIDIAAIDIELDGNNGDIDEISTLKKLRRKFEDLNLEEVGREQRVEFPKLWKLGMEEENEYTIIDDALYNYDSASTGIVDYPRLVLPAKYHIAAIARAHHDVGHMSVRKTYKRLLQTYTWTGMIKDIKAQIDLCAICQLHSRKPERYEMGEMPVASYPIEIISMDLIGPFIPSINNNRYILTIICHCTGYAEAIPIKDKTGLSVINALANQFITRHGVPEVIITDNGKEFIANVFEKYLELLKIKHRKSSPGHPQGNGRIERFNRTLKELINRLVDNRVNSWESVVASAMLAYRSAVSDTTGFSPFYLMYGRNVKLPFATLLQLDKVNFFEERLNNLSKAFKIAKELTQNSRKFNRERLRIKAHNKDISVGDSVVLCVDDRITFASRWDPHWKVAKVFGKVLVIVHDKSHKRKSVSREKVRLINPHVNWDEINERITRTQLNQFKRGNNVEILLTGGAGHYDPLEGTKRKPRADKIRDIRQMRKRIDKRDRSSSGELRSNKERRIVDNCSDDSDYGMDDSSDDEPLINLKRKMIISDSESKIRKV